MKQLIFRLITIGTNVRDFFGLFLPVKKQKNKGLRILIFNWRDTKHSWAGGAEIYIHELSKQMVKSGHTVTLFCGNDQYSKRNETIDGVTIIRRGGFYTVYVWAFLYYIFKLRNNSDVIIDSENGIPFFTPFFATQPIILLIHHVHQEIFIEQMKFPLSYIGRFIEGKLMPIVYRNKQVIAVSESSRQEIVRVGIAKQENIHVVNPGVHIPSKPYKKNENPTMIYLGRLKAYKNIDIALYAFKKVLSKIPYAQFWIVGEGDMGYPLANLVKKLKLEKNVTFFGKVSEEKKIKLLSQSWIAVQPSQIEGWGMTVLEANACKTPVVASNTKGLCDSIVHGKTGVLVKVGEKDILSDAIFDLLTNDNKRKKMSENAYLWASKFQWEICAHTFLERLQLEVLRKKPAFTFKRATYIVNRISSMFN